MRKTNNVFQFSSPAAKSLYIAIADKWSRATGFSSYVASEAQSGPLQELIKAEFIKVKDNLIMVNPTLLVGDDPDIRQIQYDSL